MIENYAKNAEAGGRERNQIVLCAVNIYQKRLNNEKTMETFAGIAVH